MLTKETIEEVLKLYENAKENLSYLVYERCGICGVCVYRKNCDEHVRCTDGIARYLYEHQE